MYGASTVKCRRTPSRAKRRRGPDVVGEAGVAERAQIGVPQRVAPRTVREGLSTSCQRRSTSAARSLRIARRAARIRRRAEPESSISAGSRAAGGGPAGRLPGRGGGAPTGWIETYCQPPIVAATMTPSSPKSSVICAVPAFSSSTDIISGVRGSRA